MSTNNPVRDMETKLIYVGSHYYNESKSLMSPIYTEEGQRYDWGFVERDLREGKSVSIRQANQVERDYYSMRLQSLKSEFEKGAL